ncbi:hypothetical protein [Microbulbifer taiwanensis]|uniref:hypothetical protein n=1 Tax=Microbulbifer taiwanensis TaxID=986746 RepID=UPI00360E26CB
MRENIKELLIKFDSVALDADSALERIKEAGLAEEFETIRGYMHAAVVLINNQSFLLASAVEEIDKHRDPENPNGNFRLLIERLATQLSIDASAARAHMWRRRWTEREAV